jgi:nucleoside-diphosphate-sugar epimerase
MKIGITGGSGFIGSWVAQRAVDLGHQPVILDRTGYLGGMTGRLVEEKTGALFLGDVRDATAMAELAAHVDGIIHLAACLGTQETILNPFPAAETNIMGGLNFLEACAQYNIPGVYIGVGNHWMNNSYSITKTAVERFVHMYNAERGTRVNIVRAVNAYGPGQSVAPPFGPAKVRKITPAFVCRALTGAPIEVYGDGQQVSDMVHVSDVATALIRALEKAADGVVFPEPVEIGPASHLSVLDVAEIVRDAAATWRAGHSLDYGSEPVGIVHLPMRPGEVPGDRVTADTATLRHVDMAPWDLVGAEEGLAATVKWYGEHWLPEYLARQTDAELAAEAAHERAQAAAILAVPAQRLRDREIPMDYLAGHHPNDPEIQAVADRMADDASAFIAGQAHGTDH